MKVVLGCDEAGFGMKQEILAYLQGMESISLEDIGCYDTMPVLYPDVAALAAKYIQEGRAERGILICGTGIGMAVTANKIKGVRAAVCHDIFSAERSILSNNVQMMCLGARVIAHHLSLLLVKRWLELEFVGGPSTEKIQRISIYENSATKSMDFPDKE